MIKILFFREKKIEGLMNQINVKENIFLTNEKILFEV